MISVIKKFRHLRTWIDKSIHVAWIRAIFTALIYYGLILVNIKWFIVPPDKPAVWLPGGFILAILLLTERNTWTLILGSVFVANFIGIYAWAGNIWLSLGLSLVNCLESLLTASLILRIRTRPFRLTSFSQVIVLTVATIISSGLASIPIAYLSRIYYGLPSFSTGTTVWLAKITGVLVLAPVLLTWSTSTSTWRPWTKRRLFEAIITIILLITSEWFGFVLPTGIFGFWISIYVVIPILVWTAIRFSGRGVSLAMLVTFLFCIPATIQGRGFFALTNLEVGQYTLVAQAFINVFCVMTAGLAAGFNERRNAMRNQSIRLMQQACLTELSQKALRSRNLQTTLDDTASICARALQVEQCEILEYSPEGDNFKLAAGVGILIEQQGKTLTNPLLESLTKSSLQRDETVVVEDFRKDSRFAIMTNDNPPIASGISTVIPKEDGPFGVLVALASRPRIFTHDDIDTIQTMARTLASSIRSEYVKKALYESEENYRNIFENATEGIFQTTLDGQFISVNPAMANMYGFASPEEMKASISDIAKQLYVTPAERERYKKILAEKGHIENFELAQQRKNGEKFWTSENAHIVRNTKGTVLYYQGTAQDITERKLTEEKLKVSEERLRLALEGANDGLWDWDIPSGYTYYSPRYYTMLGYQQGDFPYTHSSFESLLHPDDLNPVRMGDQKNLKAGGGFSQTFRLRAKSGEYRWILSRGMMVKFDDQGNPIRMIGTHTDITERVKAEELIRKSLNEKDVLLKEVHHRVKNNLNMICSLLDLQTEIISDTTALEAFQDTQQRIRAIARLHENLYNTQHVGLIDAQDYIEDLISSLRLAFANTHRETDINITADHVLFDLDTAIPFGLLINELISNAYKHAFPSDWKEKHQASGHRMESDEISIELRQQKRKVKLKVSDNGIGLPMEVEPTNSKTLGLQLVTMLSRQLRGDLEVNRDNGTSYCITWELKKTAMAIE